MKDWSDHIRELGNDSAHPNLDQDPTDPQDAHDIVSFLNFLLQYLYALPYQIQQYRERQDGEYMIRTLMLEGILLNKTKMAYFEQEDILHLAISDEPERGSIELSPNITAELNDNGELIGIELLNASAFIRDSILESVQAKILSLSKVQTA